MVDWENSIGHTFFHCSLCKLVEGDMVHMLGGKFFVFEANSISSKVVSQLDKNEHYVFL